MIPIESIEKQTNENVGKFNIDRLHPRCIGIDRPYPRLIQYVDELVDVVDNEDYSNS